MHESFLQYVWQLQYFNALDLKTTSGQPVKISVPGTLNHDSGPDFLNARIRIGEIDWVGNVEIHTKSGNWYRHGHHNDTAYHNVILHVVWQCDKPVKQNDHLIPALELKNRVDSRLITKYHALMDGPRLIPCHQLLYKVREIIKLSMLEKAAVQRLEHKSGEVMRLLKINGTDWEETTYQLLAQNFGARVNREPFLQLARAVPLKILIKHSDNLHQVEALLFGQAGFLDMPVRHSYVQVLQREYAVLAEKYKLKDSKMDPSIWKFFRMRPANFPTLRIAQFSAIIGKQRSLFSKFMEIDTPEQLQALFDVCPSEYWSTHYRFESETRCMNPSLGKQGFYMLVINAVAPLLVGYGRFRDRQELVDRALFFLQHIPAEDNKIIREWNKIGFSAHSALMSQGLIELNNNFCVKKKCLSCNIGTAILAPDS